MASSSSSSSSLRLQGKIAIVTGASSGIGRAIALAFHREGAAVVCADLQESEAADSTSKAITLDGGRAVFVKTDATREGDVEALVQRAVGEFGRVDIFVNNAGAAFEAQSPRPIWEMRTETWDKTFAVNSRGVMLGCKYAAKQMIRQEPHASGDRGWIVNVASVHGLTGLANAAGYVSSKHSVVGLTKTVALDCAPYRVHCNAICPAYIRTALTEALFQDDKTATRLESRHSFRGFGVPDDIAKVAVFLASEDNTWMTGSAVAVDGGYTAL